MAVNAAQRTQIVDLIHLGKGRNQIAKLMQVSPALVTKIAQENGLNFDRTATEQANRSRMVDIRATRSKLEADLLQDAANLRLRMWTPMSYIQYVGRDGEQREDILQEPLPKDQLDLMRACGLAVDKSLRLAEANTDEGLDQAKSMLGNLLTAMGAVVKEPQAEASDA